VNKNRNIRKIAFAGSGNVAWHLAQVLYKNEYQITGIWSRDLIHAFLLAEKCDSVVCTDISDLTSGADLIIIAVPDRAIEFVVSNLVGFDGIVAHTAGSVAIDVLAKHVGNYGSFYPLQTFSKEIPVSFDRVPFFLEASDNDTLHSLREVAVKLSAKVYEADSKKRLMLHIAAVFAGNYTNLMYIISNKLLNNVDLPDDVLHPLILETARKAVNENPLLVQTGPARRMDTSTLEKHLSALASMPEYAELYNLLAQNIIKQYE
jgi:predicted short-subunit dehydrogenase-like oxidoreductase (DUF2520 family)